MTAGLPGSGLVGLFYLIASLAIPLRELWLVAHGDIDRARMRLAWRQFAVGVGILGALWISTRLATLALAVTTGDAGAHDPGVPATSLAMPFLVTLGALSGVLLLVELLAWRERRRSTRARRLADVTAEPWSGADSTAQV